MKFYILFLLNFSFLISSAQAQVWDHKTLAGHLGYDRDHSRNTLLSDDEIEGITTYTWYDEPYYKYINSYLRNIELEDEDAGGDWSYYIKNIDSAIQTVPELPDNLLLFRGSGLSYRNNKPYKVGSIFLDKAYFSTFLDFRSAKNWTPEKGVTYVIYSSKRIRDGIVCNDIENEVLLPRSSVFKVMD